MDQAEKAHAFKALHVKGAPLVLWNIWDAGSAKAVADAGAKAIATGSWAVAAAQGFADGEALPMQDALKVARQVVGACDLPVTIDFESGYADNTAELDNNVRQLVDTGAVGLNIEDRMIHGPGLYDRATQAQRIAAVRRAAEEDGVPFFINARTDVFFSGSKAAPDVLLEDVRERAIQYAQAGANGLFVPGLTDLALIEKICSAQDLPVNLMRMANGPSIAELAQAGVARISHGPGPYIAAMKALGAATLT